MSIRNVSSSGLRNRTGLSTTATNNARATVASAASADIWAAAGNQIDWTGTVTATGFPAAPQAGAERVLITAGAAPFTAGANMLIDGVASGVTMTCAANDTVTVRAVTTTQFKLSRVKYDGTAVVASASGLTLLSTVTASSSATVDIETTFNSTYGNYKLVGSSIRFDTNNVSLLSRLKKTTYRTADYKGHCMYVSSGTDTYIGLATTTDSIQLGVSAGGADSRYALDFVMYIFNPSSTTLYCLVSGEIVYVANTEVTRGGTFTGNHTGATGTVEAATTGVRFLPSAGLITAGTFRLYGISNS